MSQRAGSTPTRGPGRVAVVLGPGRPRGRPGGSRGGGRRRRRLHEVQRRVPRVVVPAASASAVVGVVPGGRLVIGGRRGGARGRRRGEMMPAGRQAVGEVPREERGAVLGDELVERGAGAGGDVGRRAQPGGARASG